MSALKFSFFNSLAATQLHLRTTSLSESAKIAEQAQKSPLGLETSISTPLLMIESKSIQASTIPEESSRANSEANLPEKLKAEMASATQCATAEVAAVVVIETDKSSSQSSLPIINVSEAADDIEITEGAPEDILEETVERVIDYEEDEKPAEASCPEEQTLSRENIPGVIKKLSIQSEEQLMHEQTPQDEDELLENDFIPGYVPPAPTPAPSMAPLAEVEFDPEEDTSEAATHHQHVDAEVVQIAGGSSQETGDAHHHKKRKKKKESTAKDQPIKGNPVCPWEDE